MSRNAMLAIVVIVIVLAGGWWLLQSQKGPSTPSPLPTINTTEQSSPSPQTESTGAAMETKTKNAVTITANGFSPQNLTIKVGDSVTWTNQDSASHIVNSDPHPTHTTYPPLNNVGVIPSGQSKSFTFSEAGTFRYHDHLNPSSKGVVVVE